YSSGRDPASGRSGILRVLRATRRRARRADRAELYPWGLLHQAAHRNSDERPDALVARRLPLAHAAGGSDEFLSDQRPTLKATPTQSTHSVRLIRQQSRFNLASVSAASIRRSDQEPDM